jgi:hypothetical protein
MSGCCQAATQKTSTGPKTASFVGRVREMLAWAVPSVILLLVPKCPVCLAAHVALWTGLGLSLSTATWLRWGMLFVCVGSLIFLVVRRLHGIRSEPHDQSPGSCCQTPQA